MRLLLVTPFVPDASAAHGGSIYLASLVAGLRPRAELGLVALTADGSQPGRTPGADWGWSATVARPPSGPGAALPDRLAMLWRWRWQPLVAAKHWHPEVPSLLARALAEWRPDAVLIEMAQMAQYLPALHGVPTVLTDHEAGCPANTTTGLGPVGDRRDRRLWRHYVERFYPLADLLQAVTAEDAAALAAQLGTEVVVRPPAFPVPAQPVAPERAPPRALFAGDYSHAPNPEAARVLVREVLPRVRAVQPSAELWLAGTNQECIRDLAGEPGVRLVGFVPDLSALFRDVRLMLAPVWSGGGFRMKSVAALAHGLPVVTNSLGARGCAAPADARAVVEGPDALAAATARWLSQPELAASAGRAAHSWARANLSVDAVAAAQVERIDELIRRRRTG